MEATVATVATVGVDLGGRHVVVVVVDDVDERRGGARMLTPPSGDRTTVMDVMEAAVHAALGDASISLSDVSAVGVGTPGVVIDGTVGGATNVPGWYERFGLAEGFAQKLGVPVRVANDVTAATVAEHRFGAGEQAENLLGIKVGTGVGAGLILGGQPYEGSVGGAGEFGHTVVALGGAVCPCGRRGCVEAYAGRRAIVHSAERAVAAGRETILFKIAEERGGTVTSGAIQEALDKGDELVADLIDQAVAALGAGIASTVNLLDVHAVVVGGALADHLGDRFLRQVDAAMRPHLFLQPPRIDRLRAAVLGEEAGALGAAIMARALAAAD